MKPDRCANYSSSQQSSCNNGSSSCGSNRIRVIRLRRKSDIPLGFSVRGGREHGTGIFVSEVKAGSEAHNQGLLVGDQILRINGFNIEHAIHDEVLALLRAKPGAVIKVKSMGIIPVKETKKDPLTWRIVDPGPTSNECTTASISHDIAETRISIPSIGPSGLGCSIVKGPTDVPGIYVQSVKSGSLAEKAGLQIGDRILEMNGHNFTNLDFPDAVAVLKSSKQMMLVLCKGVGIDLFPEEKLRRVTILNNAEKQCESKQSEDIEKETRVERDNKKMNGNTPRVNNGLVQKPIEGELKLNGNHTYSQTDVSPQQILQDGIHLPKYGHCVRVSATVHSSSGDDENISFDNRCARELGDGMDFETLNVNNKLHQIKRSHWENSKNEHNLNALCNNSSDYNERACQDISTEEESSSSSLGFDIETKAAKGKQCDALFNGIKNRVNSTCMDDRSEVSSMSSDDYLGIPKIASQLENDKQPNEFLKRKQHELLMEEFREVHKKMFGKGPPNNKKAPRQMNSEMKDQSNLYKRRQQVRKDRHTPPPPPDANDLNEFNTTEFCDPRLTTDIDKMLAQDKLRMTAKTVESGYHRRQRNPTTINSLDVEPIQTYFDKVEGGLKPLVTIGTYSNGIQQNRFLNNNALKTRHNDIATNGNYNTEINGLVISVNQKPFSSASTGSTNPSSSSSEPRSPTSESTVSSDSLFNSSSPNSLPKTKDEEIPNSFHAKLMQFTKNEKKLLQDANIKNKKKSPIEYDKIKCASNKVSEKQKRDLNREEYQLQDFEREADGRMLKTIILKKNGPLNFTVEGGKNSDSTGKIIVCDVWEGSCSTEGGTIDIGDQILLVDDIRLTGLTLTAANVALRNANSNAKKEMKLIIAKKK